MFDFLTPLRRRKLPIRTPYSPPLTPQEIEDILEYPQDTGYTYARSFSYSSSFPEEYTNPVVGYRHSLSNSGFENESKSNSFFKLIHTIVFTVLRAFYNALYCLAGILLSYTPLCFLNYIPDIDNYFVIFGKFLQRMAMILLNCIKAFVLKTGYSTVAFKNDVVDGFLNLFGYRYVPVNRYDTRHNWSGEHVNRSYSSSRYSNSYAQVKSESWIRRAFNSVVYVVTFGNYPAHLCNAGVVPPHRTYHRTSGLGQRGFIARNIVRCFGFVYYILTAGFLFENLEPMDSPSGVRTRSQAAMRQRYHTSAPQRKFRWWLLFLILSVLASFAYLISSTEQYDQIERRSITYVPNDVVHSYQTVGSSVQRVVSFAVNTSKGLVNGIFEIASFIINVIILMISALFYQIWTLFKFVLLLPFKLFASDGYIRIFWEQIRTSFSNLSSYVIESFTLPLSHLKTAVMLFKRPKTIDLVTLAKNQKNIDEFESRVLDIIKKNSLPYENKKDVFDFSDDVLYNRISAIITKVFTENPHLLDAVFKQQFETQLKEAIRENNVLNSAAASKDKKEPTSEAMIDSAIENYMSLHFAKILSDFHLNYPSHLKTVVNNVFANDHSIQNDIKSMIKTIVKDENHDKKDLAEKLMKIENIVMTQNGKSPTDVSVSYLDTRLSEVYSFFDAKLRNFSYDRTGEPDYALESSGGFIVSTRCTEEYDVSSRRESVFGIPLWYTQYTPRYVIQRPSITLNPGECWAVKGNTGFLVIQLMRPIKLTSVTYEHIEKAVSPDGTISSAPKMFKLWSLQTENDPNKVLIGHYFYDENGDGLQRFVPVQNDPRGTPMVEFEVTENYGASYTCIYRLRVHGTPL